MSESGFLGVDGGRVFEMERLWEAKDWAALAELETQVWSTAGASRRTGWTQEIRRRVQDWILANYRADLVEGKPQPFDPSAAGRLAELNVPTLVMIGLEDEPGCVVAERQPPCQEPGWSSFRASPT